MGPQLILFCRLHVGNYGPGGGPAPAWQAVIASVVNTANPIPRGPDFVSTDFSAGVLEPGWNVVNPLGSGSVSFSGAGSADAVMEIAVDGGINHNPWVPNESVRAGRFVPDGDVEIEANFDTVPTEEFQMEGLLFEQSDRSFLRFEVYADSAGLHAFAAQQLDGAATILYDRVIPGGLPEVYLRVTRSGDQWTFATSPDGITWTVEWTGASPIRSDLVSVHAGNYGTDPATAPAWTAKVDYVVNTAMPLAAEDGVGAPVPNPT